MGSPVEKRPQTRSRRCRICAQRVVLHVTCAHVSVIVTQACSWVDMGSALLGNVGVLHSTQRVSYIAVEAHTVGWATS